VDVREDPRLTVPADVRAGWTQALLGIADVHRRATELLNRWQPMSARLRPGAPTALTGAQRTEASRLNEQLEELYSRLGRLYGDVEGWTGPMTADQRTQLDYLTAKLAEFTQAVDRMVR
jgi:hypothetical protein